MSKRVRVLLFSALGVMVFIALTIAALVLVFGSTRPERPDPVSSSPSDVLAYYTEHSVDFWSGFESPASESIPVGLLYENGNRRYEVDTDAHVLHVGSENQKSFEDVQSNTTSILKDIQFSVVSKQDTRVLYANENKLCQLRAVESEGQTYSLSCTYTSKVNDYVARITELMGLYEAADAEGAKALSSTTIGYSESKASDRISYATLSFSGQNSDTAEGYARLLFASLNGTWEFVANLNNAAVPSDGKRSVSEADLLRMNDEKWEGVLSNVF